MQFLSSRIGRAGVGANIYRIFIIQTNGSFNLIYFFDHVFKGFRKWGLQKNVRQWLTAVVRVGETPALFML